MNKAITQGLVLMPPAFSAGLNLWSREDGRAGQGSYLGQANAAFVPNDQDFAGCLELQKTSSVQKLRSFQQIPFQPGLYLRVTVRIKAMSGALPSTITSLTTLTYVACTAVAPPGCVSKCTE